VGFNRDVDRRVLEPRLENLELENLELENLELLNFELMTIRLGFQLDVPMSLFTAAHLDVDVTDGEVPSAAETCDSPPRFPASLVLRLTTASRPLCTAAPAFFRSDSGINPRLKLQSFTEVMLIFWMLTFVTRDLWRFIMAQNRKTGRNLFALQWLVSHRQTTKSPQRARPAVGALLLIGSLQN
jgi:hypothetical protein